MGRLLTWTGTTHRRDSQGRWHDIPDGPEWYGQVYRPVYQLYQPVPGQPAINQGTGAIPELPPAWDPRTLAAVYDWVGHAGPAVPIVLLQFGQRAEGSDLLAFSQRWNLPTPDLDTRLIGIDGTTEPAAPVGVEATLDAQWAHAAAPTARLIECVLVPPSLTHITWAQALTVALDRLPEWVPPPAVVSISYGLPEDLIPRADLLAWAAAVDRLPGGYVVVAASGDQGAYGYAVPGVLAQTPRVSAPASVPGVIAVGGTTLTPVPGQAAAGGPPGRDEWCWSFAYGLGASGGGYSAVFPRPLWQSGVARSGAGVPDVAAVADPNTGAYVVVNGSWTIVGGTSLAAPLVAGLLAQALAARPATRSRLTGQGLLERLYDDPAPFCRPITMGTNQTWATPGYNATAGWNPATGWGVPRGLDPWMRLVKE
jgi:kumamolisin